MKDIIIEIEATVDAGVEDELIKLGNKCDVDIEHLPFKEFQVNIIPSRELEKKIERDLIEEEMEKRIALFPQITMTERIEMYDSIRSKISKSKDKMNKLLTSIEIEFLENIMKIQSTYCYNVELILNKKQFNMTDEDLDIRIKSIELFRQGNEDAVLKELQDNTSLVFGILAFMKASKEIVKSTRVKREPVSSKYSNNKKKSNKKKKTYLYNKIYKLNKDSLSSATKKAAEEEGIKESKREYHISSWYQRGHWRNYKSGKKVWIEAQFKHPKNLKKEDAGKTYKITKVL